MDDARLCCPQFCANGSFQTEAVCQTTGKHAFESCTQHLEEFCVPRCFRCLLSKSVLLTDSPRASSHISFPGYYCFKHWLHSVLIKHTSLPQHVVDILISKGSFWFGGIIAGLSIFIEKPQRRAELAMYVLPKGLETLWVTAQGHGWVMRTGNYGDILVSFI